MLNFSFYFSDNLRHFPFRYFRTFIFAISFFFPPQRRWGTIPLPRVSNKWVRSQRSCLTGCGDPVIDTHQQNDIWDQHNTNGERKRRAGTRGGCGNSSQASGHIPTGDFAKKTTMGWMERYSAEREARPVSLHLGAVHWFVIW